jgi:hypothetical protein
MVIDDVIASAVLEHMTHQRWNGGMGHGACQGFIGGKNHGGKFG